MLSNQTTPEKVLSLADFFQKKKKNLFQKLVEEKKNISNNGQTTNKEITKKELYSRRKEMMKYQRSVSCNQLVDLPTTQAQTSLLSNITSPGVQCKVINLVSPASNTERKTENYQTERKTCGKLSSDKKNKQNELLERLTYGLKAKVSTRI